MTKLINEHGEQLLSIREAAEFMGVSKAAVAAAIGLKRLVAGKNQGRWFVTQKALDDYCAHKFSREHRRYNGELVFDPEKGRLSVGQVAKMLSSELKRRVQNQYVYYMLRQGRLKGERLGSTWVIKREAAMELLETMKPASKIVVANII